MSTDYDIVRELEVKMNNELERQFMRWKREEVTDEVALELAQSLWQIFTGFVAWEKMDLVKAFIDGIRTAIRLKGRKRPVKHTAVLNANMF